MKLSAYHKSLGDSVILMKGVDSSSRLVVFDKVYISCVFEVNADRTKRLSEQFDCEVFLGGVGVSSVKLPVEVEHLMPDYDLYGEDYSMGFATRGCINSCSFCKVPSHEGMICVNADIYEFWDKRHKKILLLDNNILASPKHFFMVAEQIKAEGLVVDFNQGLDHRLLTPEICEVLLGLRHLREIRFAFDHVSYKPSVLKALKLLRGAGLRDWGSRWYVYVGVEDTFMSVYERLLILREAKQAVYVMRDKKVYGVPEFVALASWGNTMGAFKLASLSEIVRRSERMRPYRRMVDVLLHENGDTQKYINEL